MAVDTIARHYDRPVETCSSATDVQEFLLTYSNDSTLSNSDLLKLSLAASIASLESFSGQVTVIALRTSFQDLKVDVHLFNI